MKQASKRAEVRAWVSQFLVPCSSDCIKASVDWSFMLLSERPLVSFWKLLIKNPFLTDYKTHKWEIHTRGPRTSVTSISVSIPSCGEEALQRSTHWIWGCSSYLERLHSKGFVPWNWHLLSSLLLVLKLSAEPMQLTLMCARHITW